MPSNKAKRCHHIKSNGMRCGSPALRNQRLCYFHHQNPPAQVAVYENELNRSGGIILPVIEDASSILVVVRKVTELLLQRMIEPKVAGLLLYGLQIASNNLKRAEEEKLHSEEMVVDPETAETAGAAQKAAQEAAESEGVKPIDLREATPELREAVFKAVDEYRQGHYDIQACQERTRHVI
jgi:hypothetical protein